MDDGNDDDYVYNSDKLVRNLQMLIERNSGSLKNKKESEFSNVDLYINHFSHHLTVHLFKIKKFYPLIINQEELESTFSSLSISIMEPLIETIDLDSKSSFITLCCFQFETILKKISEAHKIKLENKSMRIKFENVLKYFDIPLDDKLDLIDVFYWTRNTLHDGGKVNKSGTRTYAGQKYVFEIDKPLLHTHWRNFIYFASEILGIFEQILNSEKYVENPKNNLNNHE